MSKINRNQENVKYANFRYVIKIYTFVCLKLIGTKKYLKSDDCDVPSMIKNPPYSKQY